MAGYGTDQEFNDWLAAHGLSLPSESPTPAVLRLIGSTYVDAAYEHKLQCSQRAGGIDQDLAWPRTGHRVNGALMPDDMIPKQWVHASYRAAYLEATNPGWATGANDPTRVTKREKVDVLEREFFGPGEVAQTNASSGVATDSLIDAMVAMFLCTSGRNLNTLFRVI